MRFLIILFATITVTKLIAQETSNPDLQSLVNAERAFISMAKEKNTRDAFIMYLADEAVTFGPEPRIGKEYLKAQAPNDSWLSWEPVYSDISASADFGFNTGPWEFRTKRTDEKAVAFGQFVTVWRKVNDEWKAVIDMGISHGQPAHHESWKTSTVELKSKKSNKTVTSGILTAEKEFLKNFEQNAGYPAYLSVLSPDIRVYRGGKEPIVSADASQNFFEHASSKLSFTPLDGQMSSANDLGFVYGKCSVEELIDGKPVTRQSYYLRIWKKENNTWKIALDLVQ